MKTKVLSFAVMMLLSSSSLLTEAKTTPQGAAVEANPLSLGSYCTYNKQCNSNCCQANKCSGNCKASFFKVRKPISNPP